MDVDIILEHGCIMKKVTIDATGLDKIKEAINGNTALDLNIGGKRVIINTKNLILVKEVSEAM